MRRGRPQPPAAARDGAMLAAAEQRRRLPRVAAPGASLADF